MPSQWRDLHRRDDGDTGIKRLMLALLSDAIREILDTRTRWSRQRKQQRPASRTTLRRSLCFRRITRRRRTEALAWVLDNCGDGVFSFVNVCDTLGIDSEALRAGVRERQAA